MREPLARGSKSAVLAVYAVPRCACYLLCSARSMDHKSLNTAKKAASGESRGSVFRWNLMWPCKGIAGHSRAWACREQLTQRKTCSRLRPAWSTHQAEGW